MQEAKQNLELAKVFELVAQKCVSSVGSFRLNNTEPSLNHEHIVKQLELVTEVKSVYESESGLPLWGFSDVRPLIAKIEPLDSYLDAQECQQIQNLLEIVSELLRFFDKQPERYPKLNQIIASADTLNNLHKLIINTIEPSGTIFDNASPDLKRIRHEITNISKQINIKLDRILSKQSEHLQENYITLREGRLVLPVREFSVNKIPGIVHGQSASGQTHFVEPFSVVTLNNEMHELRVQEKREIIKILKRISSVIRDNADQLLQNQEVLIQLDVLQAKAQYAISVKGVAPKISSELQWNLVRGYHPVLLKKLGDDAVPLSLQLGEENRIMVITGPNAGGKTVALKTLGLLQMMVQAGFHVPVDEKSRFPVCQQIFSVIGDDQSIEDDLSTFSSHITKLDGIITSASEHALILIDEIGTGTDPAEGSALAIAILEELNRPNLATVVTTHHSELKVFAHKMDNVQNAAMQFDRETLTPRYELETGVPGSSYAFDISRRLGVTPAILDRAKGILGESHQDLEEMILALSDVKQRYQNELANLSIKKSELDGMQALYRTRSDALHKKRKQFEKDALDEAQEILNKVNKTIESVVREIRESNADKEVLKNGRKRINDLKTTVKKKQVKPKPVVTLTADQLKTGMTVRSKRFAVNGQIEKVFTDKNEVEIELNGIKIIVPVNDLETVRDVKAGKQAQPVTVAPAKSVLNEIDIRGMTADEAILEVEKYLDSALNSEWQELRIIHGKGTGILRQKVHEYLKKYKNVFSFRLGRVGEGDTGVTIVDRHN